MDQAAARWNKLCWRAVRSPPIAWLAAGPWARAHGIEDAAPIGANSQRAGRLYVRATLLLFFSVSPSLRGSICLLTSATYSSRIGNPLHR